MSEKEGTPEIVPSGPHSDASSNTDEVASERSWVSAGIASGVIGAAVIAVFFLGIDLADGQPLHTPGSLGSMLFLGEPLAVGETPAMVIVVAYTVMHGVIFLSLGLIAAYVFIEDRRRLAPTSGLSVAVALFAGFEIIFIAFAVLMAPGMIGEFGAGTIAASNLIAAIAMAAVIVRTPRE